MGLIKLGQKLGEKLKEKQSKAKILRAGEDAQREILKEKLKQARFAEQIKQAEILGKARAKAQFAPKFQALKPRKQISPTAFENVIFGARSKQQKSASGLSKKEKKKLKKQIRNPVSTPRQIEPNLSASKFAGAVD